MLPTSLLVALAALLTGLCWARSHDAGHWTGLVLPEPLVGSGALLDASNATVLGERLVTKRADPTFDDFVLGGRYMYCVMRNTQADAIAFAAQNPFLRGKPMVSPYTNWPADIDNAGWFYDEPDETSILTGLQETADALNDIGGAAGYQGYLYPVYLRWAGPTVPKTTGGSHTMGAGYSALINVGGGVIIATDSFSPAGDASENHVAPDVYGPHVPQPNNWSDLMFLEYSLMAYLRSIHFQIGALTHVFQIGVRNEETNAVIDEVLRTYQGPKPTSWATRAIFRPPAAGATEETEQNIGFYALLYTSNARGTAWMLVQHKAQMGLRYVDEIAVWQVPGKDPHMYVHIADYVPPS